MSNIFDYMDWRGDLSFSQAPFNEVDNIILSQLAYVDFSGIIDDTGRKNYVLLKDAKNKFFELNEVQDLLESVSMTKSSILVLEKMAQTRRYKNIKLYSYVKDINQEEQSQFSVITAELENHSVYVAFSGTDETLVGWREDFNMVFLPETPGHRKAVTYINNLDLTYLTMITLGGHSKGGNLAVYGGMKCQPEIRRLIKAIYNNDGPGFSKKIVSTKEYLDILPLIHTFVPESSMVGILFEHSEKLRVIKSCNDGMSQHDPMSWQVLGTNFVLANQLKKNVIIINEALENGIMGLDVQQRKQLVNSAFAILEGAGIKTVDDFFQVNWHMISDALKAKKELPEESSKVLGEALKMIWHSGREALKKSRQQDKIEKI